MVGPQKNTDQMEKSNLRKYLTFVLTGLFLINTVCLIRIQLQSKRYPLNGCKTKQMHVKNRMIK